MVKYIQSKKVQWKYISLPPRPLFLAPFPAVSPSPCLSFQRQFTCQQAHGAFLHKRCNLIPLICVVLFGKIQKSKSIICQVPTIQSWKEQFSHSCFVYFFSQERSELHTQSCSPPPTPEVSTVVNWLYPFRHVYVWKVHIYVWKQPIVSFSVIFFSLHNNHV